MRELLEKWARLEPVRIVLLEGGKVRFPPPLNATMFCREIELDRVAAGILLAAVIDAIEARGWEWTLWGDGREREGIVHVVDSDPKKPRRNYGDGLTTAPAAALLSAYLAALEAEGA